MAIYRIQPYTGGRNGTLKRNDNLTTGYAKTPTFYKLKPKAQPYTGGRNGTLKRKVVAPYNPQKLYTTGYAPTPKIPQPTKIVKIEKPVLSVSVLQSALAKSSTATLKRTIKNSEVRLNANLSANSEQSEINRIQAAANIIDDRGSYADKVYAQKKKKENEHRSSIRPFIRKHKTALAVGGIALLLFGFLVVK